MSRRRKVILSELTLAIDWNAIRRRVSQDDENWDEDYLPSPPDESEVSDSISSSFFDEIMNNSPSLEGLEFISDNEEELDEDVKSARKSPKRLIQEGEEIPDLPLQNGILL
jgi:hypothetical protein